MNKPLIGSIIFTLYHSCILIASYAGYVILTNIQLLISANILMPFLIPAYFICYGLLILAIISFDYLLYKEGWERLFKKGKEAHS